MAVNIQCPKCGFSKSVPEEKVPPGVRWANCPRCKNRFEFTLGKPGPGLQSISEKEGGPGPDLTHPACAWERRSELGFWYAIYLTTKTVLFSPRRFFATMESRGGLGEPLAYGLLSGVLGTMAGTFWQFLILSGHIQSIAQLDQIGTTFVLMAVLVLSIPYVLLVMILMSLLLHGCLLLVRGAGGGFEGTFRVVAYSQATQILSVIPFLGGLISFVWLLVVQMIGLEEIHRISHGRIIIAYLIPFLLLLGIGTVVVVSFSLIFL